MKPVLSLLDFFPRLWPRPAPVPATVPATPPKGEEQEAVQRWEDEGGG